MWKDVKESLFLVRGRADFHIQSSLHPQQGDVSTRPKESAGQK
jgi:hypothetical protein